MNDAEFILKEDIKEKKRTGSGYRYKKNGKKSKKCSLPSDNLSKKEIEKMNGECKVYNLNKPMSYSKFCAMPVDLQIKYLEMLRDKFGASINDICVMMGCYYDTFAKHKGKILNSKPKFPCNKKRRLDEKAWNIFLNGEETCDAEVAEPEEEKLNDACGTDSNEENIGDTCTDYKHIEADIVGGSITLKGKADDIFRKMTDILGYENEYEIYISFNTINK